MSSPHHDRCMCDARRPARSLALLHRSISLQQRLWADISASTTAVNAIFKERTAHTALVDQPNSIALEVRAMWLAGRLA